MILDQGVLPNELFVNQELNKEDIKNICNHVLTTKFYHHRLHNIFMTIAFISAIITSAKF